MGSLARLGRSLSIRGLLRVRSRVRSYDGKLFEGTDDSLDSWVARVRSRVRSYDGKLFESTDDAFGGC